MVLEHGIAAGEVLYIMIYNKSSSLHLVYVKPHPAARQAFIAGLHIGDSAASKRNVLSSSCRHRLWRYLLDTPGEQTAPLSRHFISRVITAKQHPLHSLHLHVSYRPALSSDRKYIRTMNNNKP